MTDLATIDEGTATMLEPGEHVMATAPIAPRGRMRMLMAVAVVGAVGGIFVGLVGTLSIVAVLGLVIWFVVGRRPAGVTVEPAAQDSLAEGFVQQVATFHLERRLLTLTEQRWILMTCGFRDQPKDIIATWDRDAVVEIADDCGRLRRRLNLRFADGSVAKVNALRSLVPLVEASRLPVVLDAPRSSVRLADPGHRPEPVVEPVRHPVPVVGAGSPAVPLVS